MADLASGKRQRIREVDVKQIRVPHFDGLKIETMLMYAEMHPNVMRALPSIQRERLKLPRSYIANLIYTIVGDPFKIWVETKVNERHEARREQADTILLDPEIADTFFASNAISGKYLHHFNLSILVDVHVH